MGRSGVWCAAMGSATLPITLVGYSESGNVDTYNSFHISELKETINKMRKQSILLTFCLVYVQAEESLLMRDILKYPTYEQIIQHEVQTHQRSKRQAISGSFELDEKVEIDADFHGPKVSIPDISFRDMASFVDEAGKTITDRFENLEKEIYKSS